MSEDLTQNMNGTQDEKLNQLVMIVSELKEQVASLSQQVVNMTQHLVSLDQKVDERLYDTRPIWEALQTQFAELRTEQEKGFRRLDRKIEMFGRTVSDLYADERDVEERVAKLERPQV